MPSPQFDAFISYSHAADGKLASRLQTAVAGFGKPWYRLRTLRIFRDETTLDATPELWTTIAAALEESRFFILLASPAAAASKWVQREINHWRELGRAHQLLIVITDGKVVWDDAAGDFDWTRTDALPRLFSGIMTSEPLYLDLTWARTEQQVSPKDPRFRDVAARLAARIKGISLDEMIGEDVHQHRVTKRVTAGAIFLLIALTITAGLAAWRAMQSEKVALEQRARAENALATSERERTRVQLAAASAFLARNDAQSARTLLDSIPVALRSWGWAVLRTQCSFRPFVVTSAKKLEQLGFASAKWLLDPLPSSAMETVNEPPSEVVARRVGNFTVPEAQGRKIVPVWTHSWAAFSRSDQLEPLTAFECDTFAWVNAAVMNSDGTAGAVRLGITATSSDFPLGRTNEGDLIASGTMGTATEFAVSKNDEENLIPPGVIGDPSAPRSAVVIMPMPNRRLWGDWLTGSKPESIETSLGLFAAKESATDTSEIERMRDFVRGQARSPKESDLIWEGERLVFHVWPSSGDERRSHFFIFYEKADLNLAFDTPVIAEADLETSGFETMDGAILSTSTRRDLYAHFAAFPKDSKDAPFGGVFVRDGAGVECVAFGSGGECRLWDRPTPRPRWAAGERGGRFAPQDMHLAANSPAGLLAVLPFEKNGALAVLRVADGKVVARMREKNGELATSLMSDARTWNECQVRFSPKGTYLSYYAAHRRAREVRAWSASTGKPIAASSIAADGEGEDRSPASVDARGDLIWVDWDQDEQFALRAYQNGCVEVLTPNMDAVLATLRDVRVTLEPPRFPTVSATPDRKQLLIGRYLIDTNTWQVLFEFPGTVMPNTGWQKVVIQTAKGDLEILDMTWWRALMSGERIVTTDARAKLLLDEVRRP
jgi:hypothetical protein